MLSEFYVTRLPLLHTWDGGKTWNTGGFDANDLTTIHDVISKNFERPVIVETGAGNSTIVFLLSDPKEVISICPDRKLFERIETYCNTMGFPLSSMRAINGYSQIELPKLVEKNQECDFALIDGAHGWPMVMVDFCFVNAMLRQGGVLLIDDTQLYSVRELVNLLREQEGFRVLREMKKSIFFVKETSDRWLPEWASQPYIVKRSG